MLAIFHQLTLLVDLSIRKFMCHLVHHSCLCPLYSLQQLTESLFWRLFMLSYMYILLCLFIRVLYVHVLCSQFCRPCSYYWKYNEQNVLVCLLDIIKLHKQFCLQYSSDVSFNLLHIEVLSTCNISVDKCMDAFVLSLLYLYKSRACINAWVKQNQGLSTLQ